MRSCLIVLLVTLATLVRAQGPPVGGGDPATAYSDHDYVRLFATVSSDVAEEGWVSGTRVIFGVNTHGMGLLQPEDPSMMQANDFVGWRLDGYTVTVGGETVRTYDRATHPAPPPGSPPPAPDRARCDSPARTSTMGR